MRLVGKQKQNFKGQHRTDAVPTRVPDVAVLPDRVGLWPGPWAPTRCPGAGRGDLLFTPLFASSERRQSTTSLEPTRSSSSLSLPCSCVPSRVGTFGFPALSSYAHACSSLCVCLSLPAQLSVPCLCYCSVLCRHHLIRKDSGVPELMYNPKVSGLPFPFWAPWAGSDIPVGSGLFRTLPLRVSFP